MVSRKVIVFGPTGGVGSAAARTAEALGASVVLAMRDTSKSIPGLDEAKEKQGNFERVQADLTQPDSITDAVNKTGAKYAFIYLAHGMPDGMKTTVQALKSAGIEEVVFLSSFLIEGDIKDVPQKEILPWVHAQVEINLAEAYGENGYIALRPGYFAGNLMMYKSEIEKGEIKLCGPDGILDLIVPEDIGTVAGTVLAKGVQDGQKKIIYLYGPQFVPQIDAVKTILKAIGKDPKITVIDGETAYKVWVEERGMPPPFARYMANQSGKAGPGPDQILGTHAPEDFKANVEKYSGKKSTTFEEWLEKNKQAFTS